MVYDRQSLNDINQKHNQVGQIRDRLSLQLGSMLPTLKNHQAKEYLAQGVGRRLEILARCIENIFRIFPIDRSEHLPREERLDLGINLHAFIVNVTGLFDNLGWVFVHENNLYGKHKDGKLEKKDVGLFEDKTQSHLSETYRAYLTSDSITNWYSKYSKNYRDALAHRIPLYVPPSVLSGSERAQYLEVEAKIQALDLAADENWAIYDQLLNKQEQIGKASPFFTHSFEEGSRPVLLHAQIINDFLTVEEIVSKFCEQFEV
jgi:hypothetical protein